jgi:hypothetical protein
MVLEQLAMQPTQPCALVVLQDDGAQQQDSSGEGSESSVDVGNVTDAEDDEDDAIDAHGPDEAAPVGPEELALAAAAAAAALLDAWAQDTVFVLTAMEADRLRADAHAKLSIYWEEFTEEGLAGQPVPGGNEVRAAAAVTMKLLLPCCSRLLLLLHAPLLTMPLACSAMHPQAGEVQANLLPERSTTGKNEIKPTSIDQMVEVFIFKRILPTCWRGRLSWLQWKTVLCGFVRSTQTVQCPYHMQEHLQPIFRAMGFFRREEENRIYINKSALIRAFNEMM